LKTCYNVSYIITVYVNNTVFTLSVLHKQFIECHSLVHRLFIGAYTMVRTKQFCA